MVYQLVRWRLTFRMIYYCAWLQPAGQKVTFRTSKDCVVENALLFLLFQSELNGPND